MIDFLVKYQIFGFSSIIGLIVALLGFYITIKNVVRTRKTAKKTQEIVREVTKDISRIETVSELSATLKSMDEIKNMFLKKDIRSLPERCNEMRKNLISIREAYRGFTPEQSAVIQGAITYLNRMESGCILMKEKNEEPKNISLFNKNFNKCTDELHVVLINLKKQIGRSKNEKIR